MAVPRAWGPKVPTRPAQLKPKPQPKPLTAEDLYRQALLAGPDYSGVQPIDYDALAKLAQQKADAAYESARAPFLAEQERLSGQRKLSTDQAQNFTAAMLNILTGGQGDEAARMAYAKENFGGSYMAAMAAQMGQDLIGKITSGFNERDFEIGQKLGELAAQKPQILQDLLDELTVAEEKRQASQLDMADEAYDSRLKRFAALYALSTKPVGKKQAVKVITAADGSKWVFDPNTGKKRKLLPGEKPAAAEKKTMSDSNVRQWDEIMSIAYFNAVADGFNPKKALSGFRAELRKYGYPGWQTWTPNYGYRPDAPEPEQIGMSVTEARGVAKDRTANGGTVWDVKKLADGSWKPYDTGRAKPRKPKPAEDPSKRNEIFYETQREIVELVQEWRSDESAPETKQRARAILWNQYGMPLVGRGFKRKAVQQMIARALAGWRPPPLPESSGPAGPSPVPRGYTGPGR